MRIRKYKQAVVLAVVLAALLSLLAVHSFAQTEKINNYDSLFKWSSDLGIFNGNVMIVKDKKVVYSGSFGFTDATKTKKLTAKYRFNIGSISKEFSAVSIMILQEKGKLKIDDKISAYLSDLPSWSKEVSIKNLLEYTSGLPDLNWDTISNDKDAYDDLRKVTALKFKPGTEYSYNNNDVLLRQFIVEKITGIPFNLFVKNQLFKPCRMESAILNPLPNSKYIAKSFSSEGTPDASDNPISGAVFVTNNDLKRWTECLHGERIISRESIYTLGNSFRPTNGGLGNTSFDNGTLILHRHNGQSRNYDAYLYSDLKSKLTFILTGNSKYFKLFEIADAIKAIDKNQAYKLPKKSLVGLLWKQTDSLSAADFITLYHAYRKTKNNEYAFESEGELNSFGYELMRNGRIDYAIELFKLNVTLFPSSINVYDSLADAYFTKGDWVNAKLYYNKVLELDPNNENAKKRIEKLNSNK